MTMLTVANQLTLLRMLLIPAFVLLVVYGQLGCALLRAACWRASPTRLTASSRDLPVRRPRIGAWLDPMADKLLLTSAFIVLTVPGTPLAHRHPALAHDSRPQP